MGNFPNDDNDPDAWKKFLENTKKIHTHLLQQSL
jgi:hypothetical protein